MILDTRPLQPSELALFRDFHTALAREKPKARHFDTAREIMDAFDCAIAAEALGHYYRYICIRGRMIGELFTYGGLPDDCHTGIALLSEYTGRGLGRLAMDELIWWARRQKLPCLWSSVWEDNAGALRLNLRTGFVPTAGRIVNHPYQPGNLIVWTLRYDIKPD